jgi:hypothetical protein
MTLTNGRISDYCHAPLRFLGQYRGGGHQVSLPSMLAGRRLTAVLVGTKSRLVFSLSMAPNSSEMERLAPFVIEKMPIGIKTQVPAN